MADFLRGALGNVGGAAVVALTLAAFVKLLRSFQMRQHESAAPVIRKTA